MRRHRAKAKADFAEPGSERQTLTFIRLILRGRKHMRLRTRNRRVAPVSKDRRLWGGPPISGLPEIGTNMRKSGKPDLRVRDAAHEAAESE